MRILQLKLGYSLLDLAHHFRLVSRRARVLHLLIQLEKNKRR